MNQWRIFCGILRNARNCGTFCNIAVLNVFPEIKVRRGLNAIAAAAEGDDVEIRGKDFLF